jgi:hypothetical protein
MRICALMDAIPFEEMKTVRTTDATAGPIDTDAADLTRTPFTPGAIRKGSWYRGARLLSSRLA